jgi:aspartate racemase
MGAEATADFYQRLVRCTPATSDQEHLHVIINSNAKIADRTTSIAEDSPATLEGVVETAQTLEAMGAEILAMPCNSAHYWYDDIIARIQVPLIHMIEEVFLAVESAGLGRIGLMATRGTMSSGIYSDAAGEIDFLQPDLEAQERIHEAIYKIKLTAGREGDVARRVLLDEVEVLRSEGAEGIILGCTEIPIVIGQADFEDLPIFDSTDILVDAVLREALPRSAGEKFS